jgi:hypothetical protein
MTRTQISLNEEEHRYLKLEAAGEGVSLSALIRRLVRERMNAKEAGATTVADLVGLFGDPGVTGRDHDALLYGAGSLPDGRG